MKKKLAAMMAMAMALNERNHTISREEPDLLTQKEKDEKEKANKEKLARAKGLTEFRYGQNIIWALNKKSADKKAKKRGWL